MAINSLFEDKVEVKLHIYNYIYYTDFCPSFLFHYSVTLNFTMNETLVLFYFFSEVGKWKQIIVSQQPNYFRGESKRLYGYGHYLVISKIQQKSS